MTGCLTSPERQETELRTCSPKTLNGRELRGRTHQSPFSLQQDVQQALGKEAVGEPHPSGALFLPRVGFQTPYLAGAPRQSPSPKGSPVSRPCEEARLKTSWGKASPPLLRDREAERKIRCFSEQNDHSGVL